MKDDQLTRNERIRLEALAQANAFSTMKNIGPDAIIQIAETFEDFIRKAEEKFNQ